MSACVATTVYYSSADTSQPMPAVTAADAARAVRMTPEQIAVYFPLGVYPGFTPMIVSSPGALPENGKDCNQRFDTEEALQLHVKYVHVRPPPTPGVSAEVRGLTRTPEYNGTTCTVLGPDDDSDTWLVRLGDGGRARLQGRNLRVPAVVLAPGGRARLQGMVRKPQLNGAVAKLLEWDAALEKWSVELCTGLRATVAAGNLVPEAGA